jgi:hypothetical protein
MRKLFLTSAVLLIMVCGVPAFVTAATTIKSPSNLNLQGWWTFDEGTSTIAHDFSGNGYTGTIQSAPVWFGGKRGKSLLFNGSSDYVDIGHVQDGIVDFTWSAWIKTTQNISDGNYYQAPVIIGTIQGSGDTNDASFVVNGGKLGWYDELLSGVAYDTGRVVNDGLWHHVVAVRSSTAVLFYVDGVGAGSVSTGTDPLNSNGLQIAKANWTSARFFGGNIDDVRVYNRALPAAEVLTLFRANEITQKVAAENGLLARWSFDEGTSTIAHDFSGNGYDGTLTNFALPSTATSGWISGKRVGGLAFDGSNDYIPVSNSTAANSTTSLTVSMWVYYSDLAGRTIASKWGNVATSDYSWLLFTNWFRSGGIDFLVSGNGTGYVGASSAAGSVTTNRWYYVTGVYDGVTVKLYIDGVLVNTNASGVPASLRASTAPITIGADYDNGGSVFRFFNGKIDEPRIYNRVLSAAEIWNLYKQTSTNINRSQNTELTSGLVGMWSFNGVDVNWTSSSAGIVYDRSGNNNTGTLTNMSQVDTPVSGKVGQALLLDGNNDYVEIPSSSSLLLSGDVSISVWVKPGSTQKTYADMISKHNCGGYIIEQNNNSTNQYALAWDVGGCSYTGGSVLTTLTANVWQNFVVVKSGASITHYVNGVQTASGSGAGAALVTSPTPLRIGNFGSGGSREFNGALDEVRVYNRALTALEAKQLYLMGK